MLTIRLFFPYNHLFLIHFLFSHSFRLNIIVDRNKTLYYFSTHQCIQGLMCAFQNSFPSQVPGTNGKEGWHHSRTRNQGAIRCPPGEKIHIPSSPWTTPWTYSGEFGNLDNIRRQGLCLERGAMGDKITSAAVLLFSSGGDPQGAHCFVGPHFRMTENTINNMFLPCLREAGRMTSSKLGYLGDC